MRGAVIHAPGDIRFETLDDPKIEHPTDAIIRTAVTCVCGSDLWPYRGAEPTDAAHPMGHEYVGFVEEVGPEVTAVKPGQFVVGSFATSDNTCANCRNGFQSNCLNREFMSTCQADYVRIPNAQGTLVATDGVPDERFWPGLLAVSDVMGTGWWAAEAAEVKPGATAVVVGDGAVGLCAVIAAKELGAERIIAMSRHESRQKLAREFGATDIVAERGEVGIARIKEMTGGIGADSVLECVGTAQSMQQALHSARPGGNVGFVGVPHEVAIDGQEMFFSHVGLRGGPAPVRRYLSDLIDRVLTSRIDPGKVFDLTLPLDQVAEGSLTRPAPARGATVQITRSSIDTAKGPADWFTGDVYIDAVAAAPAPSRVTANVVHFMPDARTHWHRHPLGQTVFVTEGIGLCQRRGGPVEVIRPGDRVLFEADEEHWHGAALNRLMVHLAINEGDDDHDVVYWLNPVTDEEYAAAPATS